MPPSENNSVIFVSIFVIVAVVFITVLINALIRWQTFSFERRRLNNEIQRTHGEEKRHWQRERRRLWLTLLPFTKFR